MIEYPKIETLYDRDPKTFKVIPTKLRLPEFDLPKRWLITEKIDGTNIRVNFNGKSVLIGGRTDNAQLPPALIKMLMSKFTPELFHQAFPDDTATDVTLYGEGYGARIQKSGGIYRPDPGFRLFDVRIGDWWLNWQNVEEVATALGISTVPVIYYEYDIDNLPDSHYPHLLVTRYHSYTVSGFLFLTQSHTNCDETPKTSVSSHFFES